MTSNTQPTRESRRQKGLSPIPTTDPFENNDLSGTLSPVIRRTPTNPNDQSNDLSNDDEPFNYVQDLTTDDNLSMDTEGNLIDFLDTPNNNQSTANSNTNLSTSTPVTRMTHHSNKITNLEQKLENINTQMVTQMQTMFQQMINNMNTSNQAHAIPPSFQPFHSQAFNNIPDVPQTINTQQQEHLHPSTTPTHQNAQPTNANTNTQHPSTSTPIPRSSPSHPQTHPTAFTNLNQPPTVPTAASTFNHQPFTSTIQNPSHYHRPTSTHHA
jgi:hypothetical protein